MWGAKRWFRAAHFFDNETKTEEGDNGRSENPDGYIYTSLVPRAKDLQGKLLIIHGGIDPTVVMQHSQVFVRECIKNRVPVDYFIYPRAEHNVRGYDRIHLMDKVTNYFDDYLK